MWLAVGAALLLAWLRIVHFDRAMIVFVLVLVGLVSVDVYRWRRRRYG